jgi:light-regulated signal transduction histidine kinase (bacteriophytochrome)
MDLRTVDLLAIAADALHDSRVVAPGRAITLTVDTPDAALVIGDEVRLRQVVGNLMSNAITHTPEGTPIDITIRSAPLASAGINGTVSTSPARTELAHTGPASTGGTPEVTDLSRADRRAA